MGGSLALGRVPLSAEVVVSFEDHEGRRRSQPLSVCWMVPFERVRPVREFGSYPGQRSFSGLWWSSTISDHVGYESWLERDRVMALDFNTDVVGLSSQPFRMSWQKEGTARSHTPDYFVRLRDGTGVVVDVRADDRIEPQDAETFARTALACESVGWQFRRLGAMDAIPTANLRWLAGYRHPRYLHAGRATDLQRVFQEPLGLLEGARRVGDPVAVLPTLFHLLWRQVLETDLDTAPLSAASLARCRP